MSTGQMEKPKLPHDYIRRHVWRHNSFFGSVRMAKMNMGAIEMSVTATIGAKNIAAQIDRLLDDLKEALKERDDSSATTNRQYFKGNNVPDDDWIPF